MKGQDLERGSIVQLHVSTTTIFFSSSESFPLAYKLLSYNNPPLKPLHIPASYGSISLLHFAAGIWVSWLKGHYKSMKGDKGHLAESQLEPEPGVHVSLGTPERNERSKVF